MLYGCVRTAMLYADAGVRAKRHEIRDQELVLRIQ